jgi:hypothetical protein
LRRIISGSGPSEASRAGSKDGLPVAVEEARQEHAIADRAEAPRHVAQLLAEPERVHEQDHGRVGAALLRLGDEGRHRPVGRAGGLDALTHRGRPVP